MTKQDEIIKNAKSYYLKEMSLDDIETLITVSARSSGLDAEQTLAKFREWVEQEGEPKMAKRKEATREYFREWRKKHPRDAKANREYMQKYYAENRDELVAKQRARYAENREQKLEYQREWAKKHPDKIKEYQAKAKAKRQAKKGGTD